jgi:glycosyltransferase involved in cell wall biosynthesis
MLPQRAPTRFTPLTVALTRPIENRVFRSATIVVAHTEWAARSIEQYGVPVERIRVIPFGITVADPLPYQADRPRITFVGGSLARKGGRRLLDVWRRHLRDRADLTMVTIEKVAAERGLEVRNDLRPGDPALLDVLARTTVLAFPSEVDTFGYAAIEAMACGVPVVTTRCGGLPEVVVDEVTGLLVDVGDDLALRHALERILGDPALRQRMGAAARERVLERFDATNTTTALVNVLREACELGPPRPSSW